VKNQSVCVIGARCSGLAAIKNLIQAGLSDIVCYEKNDQIGGNWIYTARESHSSICETTHIISSKKLSEYIDLPMPEEYPDYLAKSANPHITSSKHQTIKPKSQKASGCHLKSEN